MLTLSERAAKAVNRFMRFAEEPYKGLRISVKGGGCSGFQYDIALATAPEADDQVVDVSGITIFIDQTSAPLVQGMTIDFKETLTDSGFVFDNPNATGSCGCGKSFHV